MSTAAIPGNWVGRNLNGRLSLLKWLGGTEEFAVYLAELSETSQKAVVKLVPSESEEAEIRMTGWLAGADLSHPNLIQTLESGRCEIDSVALFYVLTEAPDEVLAEIIRERALTAQEAREMLDPVLDALGYLKAKGFVHGSLSPSNILAVGDSLKLSTDRLLVAGATGGPSPELTAFDAPEIAHGPIGTAADVWSLGATLVAVLTQHAPVWDRGANMAPEVPESIPEPFATIARECLRIDPGQRCTLEQIKARLQPGTIGSDAAHVATAAPAATAPVNAALVNAAPVNPAPAAAVTARPVERPSRKAGDTTAAMGKATLLLAVVALLLAGIGIWDVATHRSQPPPPVTEQSGGQAKSPASDGAIPAAPAAAPASSQNRTLRSANPGGTSTKGAVMQRVEPDVPSSAMRTISGTVRVAVRVSVAADGNVTDASFESAGPSKYFASRALDASRQWKFKPAQVGGRAVPSTWVLHFQFRQSGIDITPAETAP
jgi:TonB family protein